ncbi:unnamed protein product, partial [Rotaria sp. Silwood2]
SIYARYLNNNESRESEDFICRCTTKNTFGRFCEYIYGQKPGNTYKTFYELFEESLSKRLDDGVLTYNPIRQRECYSLRRTCSALCLDWRDLCDGEWDCAAGEDEMYCEHLDLNECNENQFRCRNGLCIPIEWFMDSRLDCVDATDEQRKQSDDHDACYSMSSIDCSEVACGEKQAYSCGDGQCLSWHERFYKDRTPFCKNGLGFFGICESIGFVTTATGGCSSGFFVTVTNMSVPCDQLVRCAAVADRSCTSNDVENLQQHVLDYCFLNMTHGYLYSLPNILSPFVDAYFTREQFESDDEDATRLPALFCSSDKAKCLHFHDVYNEKYPFPPFEYLFGQQQSLPDYCLNSNAFYICPNTHKCISNYRLLDGFDDCIDRSDENPNLQRQLNSKFTRHRYRCAIQNDETILPHLLGDGNNDCSDGSDEFEFTSDRIINWREEDCLNLDDTICRLIRGDAILYVDIYMTDLCDSEFDLQHSLDEVDCGPEWICPKDWKKGRSQTSGSCLHQSRFQDGKYDFLDGSDELHDDAPCIHGPHPWLKCGSNYSSEIMCEQFGDGNINCIGALDEQQRLTCGQSGALNNRFYCRSDSRCLLISYICNGVLDCSDGEDENELLCGPRGGCHNESFACLDRAVNGKCISSERVCDGKKNCPNGRDEETLCWWRVKHPKSRKNESISGKTHFKNDCM